MGKKIRVWTKQHENILRDLDASERYIAKREYIEQKMEEHAGLYLDVYNWYRQAAARLKFSEPPEDALFPIWVSLTEGTKIENSSGNVELELEIDEGLLTTIDIDKWGKIVNYMYIPSSEADGAEHEAMLTRYGIDDCAAYMKPFYPNIKRKIIKSWDRLFDESIVLSTFRVGTIWEMRREWIVGVKK